MRSGTTTTENPGGMAGMYALPSVGESEPRTAVIGRTL